MGTATGSLGCSHQNLLQNLLLLPVFYLEISFTSPPALSLLYLWISAWPPKDLVETSAVCQNISHSGLLNITRSRPVAPVLMAFVNSDFLFILK